MTERIKALENGFYIDYEEGHPIKSLVPATAVCKTSVNIEKGELESIGIGMERYKSMTDEQRKAWEEYYGVKLEYVCCINQATGEEID